MSCDVNRGVHVFDASDLFALIEEGSNMNITLNVVDNKVVFASTGSGPAGDGTVKWRLQTGDDFTIQDYKEYNVCGKFVIDNGVTLTIDEFGRLCIICGEIELDGEIINDGEIKFAA